MKAEERDKVLARLDERTHNMWRVLAEADDSINFKLDKVIERQLDQNGSIMKNTIYRKLIVGIGGTAVTALILHLIGVY